MAFRFAIASGKITAHALEASSYPEKANRYGVRAVPHTVVNGTENVVGAVPEKMLLAAVTKAASQA